MNPQVLKTILITSPYPIHATTMKNKFLDVFISDEDDSDSEDDLDQEVEAIFSNFIKQPRNSITEFYEKVVPLYSDAEFIRYFRLSRELFHFLADEFEKSSVFQRIASQSLVTSSGKSIAVFLWFCAHEAESYRDISNLFNISTSTVHAILRRTISFVSSLSSSVITWPSNAEMKKEADYHFKKTGIPGVIGAVDGTHITIDPPLVNKDDYIDRKGHYTIAVQAVCNSKNQFLDIAIGYPGSVHDARMFRTSRLPENLENLPPGYRLLGDSAYPLSSKLLTPYKDNGNLTTANINFNMRLSESRVIIEHSFGILKQRFRQLYYCKLRGIDTISHFIRACFVLHNLCKMTDCELEIMGIDPTWKDPQSSGCNHEGRSRTDCVNGNEHGKGVRDDICRSLFAKRKQK